MLIRNIFMMFTLLVASCSVDDLKKEKTQDGSDEAEGVANEPQAAGKPQVASKICQPTANVNLAPQSIQEFVSLINALPKPVTANCILQVLKRPMLVNATANKFSAQGATSERSPRIFIRYGKLILSFVGSGDSSKAIELAEEIDETMSIKGDIPLPVKANLTATDPFKDLSPKNSPACAELCHTEYKVVKNWENGVIEYASTIIFPKESLRTTLDDLKMFRETCVKVESEAQLCEFYKSIFDHGEVKYFNYDKAGQ